MRLISILTFVCFLVSLTSGQFNNCQVSGITIVSQTSGTGLNSSVVLTHLQNSNISFANASSQYLSCSLERTGRGILGTPGGDSGEFLAALATYFSLGGSISGQTNITQFLTDVLSLPSIQRTFYMLTDQTSLDSLSQRLSSSIPNFTIYNVPSQYQSIAFDEVVKSENIGCPHIKSILNNPTDYQLDSSVTRYFINAFFDVLWNGYSLPRPTLQVSDPQQNGQTQGAVLNVYTDTAGAGSCSAAAPLVTPTRSTSSLFVVHPTFVNPLRTQLSNYFAGILNIPSSNFRSSLDTIAASQMNQTLSRLAPGVPVYGAVIKVSEKPSSTSTTTTGVLVQSTTSADVSTHSSHTKHDILVSVSVVVLFALLAAAAAGAYYLYKKGSFDDITGGSSSKSSRGTPKLDNEMVKLEEN